MRIGLNLDNNLHENAKVSIPHTNYSTAEIFNVKDITDIGKDTSYIVDQGRSLLQSVGDISGTLDVDTQRDYMIVMSNIMSKEDYAKAMEDGFDPSNMTPEETVTILDHIKAVMAESGHVVSGYNDDLDAATLKEITGSEVRANELNDAIKKADLPLTESNAKNVDKAAKEISEIESLSDGAMKYLIDNGLTPSIENIYKASFTNSGDGTAIPKGYINLGMGGYLGKKGDDIDIEAMSLEIAKIAEQVDVEGLSLEEKTKDAKWLLSKGLEVTANNISRYEELKHIEFPLEYDKAVKIIANSVAKGFEAKDADVIKDKENIYEKAAEIVEKTNAITDENIKAVISDCKEMTLQNLFTAQNTGTVSEMDLAFVSAKRNLEEVRLKMSLDVNVRLLKSGFSLDTASLSDLVDKLKDEEAKLKDMFFKGDSAESVDIKANIFVEATKKVSEIPYMPAAVIGKMAFEEEYSLSKVHETGAMLKAKYQAANESYETLMTAPRKDLGDSIKQAFRNVDDILLDMGLPVGDDNRKAVRILGYNSMEISTGNIDIVKEALNKVTEAVNALTPARVLHMVRQGINPLELNMEELAETLNSIEDNNNEKYSKFLYKLEKSNAISESEKEAYLGIYRLVNRLEKTDSAAIGSILQSGRDITLKNLLSGMRTSKVSMNVFVDDNFGFLTDTVKKGVSISAQIEQAFVGQIGEDKNAVLEQSYTNEKYAEFMKDIVNETDLIQTEVFSLSKRYEKEGPNNENIEGKIKDLIDKFEDRDSAKAAYAEMTEAIEEVLEYTTEYVATSMEDFRAVAMCHKHISISKELSNEENYMVPMDVLGEEVTVNLVIKHTSEKGKVTTRFMTEAYGEVSAALSIKGNKVSGLVTCENRDGLDVLNQAVNKLTVNYEQADINVAIGKQNLNGENSNISEESADIDNVDTKSLYLLAKRFITAFSQS